MITDDELKANVQDSSSHQHPVGQGRTYRTVTVECGCRSPAVQRIRFPTAVTGSDDTGSTLRGTLFTLTTDRDDVLALQSSPPDAVGTLIRNHGVRILVLGW